jgi:NTP pyrophosphatase (non-canonical NTP hydrolase)
VLNELAKEVHQNAVKHGWWEEERSFGEIIALCHSELSEALEEHRNGYKPMETYFSCSKKTKDCDTIKKQAYMCQGCENRKPEGISVELADCIIRILDYCGKEGIDIDEVIRIKHEYNKSRPYRHGGKVI